MEKFVNISGICASKGVVAGKAVKIRRNKLGDLSGDLKAESPDLAEVLSICYDRLSSLTPDKSSIGYKILEFQLELLRDELFWEDVFSAIETGEGIELAIKEKISKEKSDYLKSSNKILHARTEDLDDLYAQIIHTIHKQEVDLQFLGEASHGIILAEYLTPSEFLGIDFQLIKGIALEGSSPDSHVAILAQSSSIPFICNCGQGLDEVGIGTPIVLDANNGIVSLDETYHDGGNHLSRQDDEIELSERVPDILDNAKIQYSVNVSLSLDHWVHLNAIDPSKFAGIGLFRSEYMYQAHLPDEEEHFIAIREMLSWSQDSPVTVRVFDGGGDKHFPGITSRDEINPALGVKGFRLLRTRPEIIRPQIRALARAASFGDVRVLVPMVTVPSEMDEFRALFKRELDRLKQANVSCKMPKIGMMVEVPSAVLCLEEFDADFFSIGSNDLSQYTLAIERGNRHLSNLKSEGFRAVKRLISIAVEKAHLTGKQIGFCGRYSDPDISGVDLLKLGLRNFAVTESELSAVAQDIENWSLQNESFQNRQ